MLPSGSGDKNGAHENLDVTSLSESSRTPSPLPAAKDIDDSGQSTDQEEEGENANYGEIHVIELKKEKEPLGIHLVDACTSTLTEEYVTIST